MSKVCSNDKSSAILPGKDGHDSDSDEPVISQSKIHKEKKRPIDETEKDAVIVPEMLSKKRNPFMPPGVCPPAPFYIPPATGYPTFSSPQIPNLFTAQHPQSVPVYNYMPSMAQIIPYYNQMWYSNLPYTMPPSPLFHYPASTPSPISPMIGNLASSMMGAPCTSATMSEGKGDNETNNEKGYSGKTLKVIYFFRVSCGVLVEENN